MSYTKLTDFAVKDALLSGNPAKVIRGVEFDAEFNAIEDADALNAKSSDFSASSGASLVGYLASGTDAVPTTVQDTLRKLFIKADDFISTSNTAAQNVTGWGSLVTYVNTLTGATVGGAHIQFSRGIYLFDAPILAPRYSSMVGEGKSATALSFSNTGDGIQSTWPINASNVVCVAVRDMTVLCTNGSNTGGGFVDVGGSFVELTNVRLYGWKYNVIFDQTEVSTIDQCDFEGCTTAAIWLVNGADHTAGANLNYTNRISITRNQFNLAGTTNCINDDGGSVHYIVGNNFNAGKVQIRCAGVYSLTVMNNEFEQSTDYPIHLTDTKVNGTVVGANVGFGIRENFFQTSINYHIVLTKASGGEIKSNVFSACTVAAITHDTVADISNIDISANSKLLIGSARTLTPFIPPSRLAAFKLQGNYTQKEQQYVVAALAATGSQTITPAAMDGITAGGVLYVCNPDGSSSEKVRVTAVTSTTFTATFASTKLAGWTVYVLSEGYVPVLSGATTNTPGSWTYTLQSASIQQIGNRMHFDASVTWTSSGGTGQLRLALPETSASNGRLTALTVILSGAVGVYTGVPYCQVNGGTAFALFGAVNPATGGVAAISSAIASGSVFVSGSYEV